MLRNHPIKFEHSRPTLNVTILAAAGGAQILKSARTIARRLAVVPQLWHWRQNGYGL